MQLFQLKFKIYIIMKFLSALTWSAAKSEKNTKVIIIVAIFGFIVNNNSVPGQCVYSCSTLWLLQLYHAIIAAATCIGAALVNISSNRVFCIFTSFSYGKRSATAANRYVLYYCSEGTKTDRAKRARREKLTSPHFVNASGSRVHPV